MKIVDPPLLEVRDYRAHFFTRRGTVRAVDGVSFSVRRGETLGIVGESGSGKSVTQLSYLRLLPTPPLRIMGGSVRFHGEDLLQLSPQKLRHVRGDRITLVFQEPMTSLNPYLKIGTQLIEPLLIHKGMSKKDATKKAIAALERVGIPNASNAIRSYPHEFSGGMRQRVMIAMTLTTDPELLIADEPTTALDVTVQAQILELLKSIQKENGMAIVLITHDLGVVAGVADRVLVMYGGRVMEEASVDTIFEAPKHPYTLALLRSTPRMDVDQKTLPAISGTPPDLALPLPGCPFASRCPDRFAPCDVSFPEPKVSSPEHRSFCHLEGKLQ